jgi:hypothetical protein
MAILLADSVWEGLSTEPRPTVAEGARDGQFYKELDTGESYIRRFGTWHFINLGLSFIKATKSGSIVTAANGTYSVAFTTPFISSDYGIALTVREQSWGNDRGCIAYYSSIAPTGFNITTRDVRQGNTIGGVTVSWLATRHYNP